MNTMRFNYTDVYMMRKQAGFEQIGAMLKKFKDMLKAKAPAAAQVKPAGKKLFFGMNPTAEQVSRLNLQAGAPRKQVKLFFGMNPTKDQIAELGLKSGIPGYKA